MKQQKLIQVRLDEDLEGNTCIELAIEKYLNAGWVIASYQVCPVGGEYSSNGNVVILLEKEK